MGTFSRCGKRNSDLTISLHKNKHGGVI
jgi:hypothetical protein